MPNTANTDNDHNNDNEQNEELLDWKQKVDVIISIRKYRKNELINLLKKNNLDHKGRLAQLKQRIYDNPNINMDVLLVQPPNQRACRSNSRISRLDADDDDAAPSENDSGSNGVRNENVDADVPGSGNQPANDDEEKGALEYKTLTEEEYKKRALKDTSKIQKALRHEMMIKLNEFDEKMEKYKELLDAFMITYQFQDNDKEVVFKWIDDLLKLGAECKELYKIVPRRQRSQYAGRAELILDSKKRSKQFENEFNRMMTRVC